jgi:regulator of PEP synthase PpsR (kinase-PPPase family)
VANQEKKIVIVSDGTGKTAKRLMDAVLAQYSQKQVEFDLVDIYPEVRDRKRFNQIMKKIDSRYLVITSIIARDLSIYCHEQLSKRGVLHLNVLEPMVTTMSKFLGVHPDFQPGILQAIDDRYYEKVDAIGFTVEHDDGLGQLHDDADIILVGLSRTCKTPISMYLACNFGMKVANIPIIADDQLARNLLRRLAPLKRAAIFGLTMQADVLAHVREERSRFLADPNTLHAEIEGYYDVRGVRDELRFCRQLFNKQHWPAIDVTRRAIEEISLEILYKIEHKD